ncbi:MAG: DUF2306 domain-containing protein [Chitinophagales bacterium]|nr:DUF2306 domain-containing protein [Chitinophagales bacterium]
MTLFKTLQLIHIAGGSTSILLGIIVLSLKKGDKRHKWLGNIYFYAMLIASIVAIPMSYLHPSYFLFIVAIFTIYMLLTGYRYLSKKKIQDVSYIDWLLTGSILVFGFAFIGFGIYHIVQQDYFGIVLLVFGSICLLFAKKDYENFKGKSNIKNYWLTGHIQRMMGSYIASTTAFLVVNNTVIPNIIAWLIPTFLIAPLITRWSKQHEIKK